MFNNQTVQRIVEIRETVTPLAFDAAVRGVLLLSIAWLATGLLMRRASAAARHAAWCAALMAMLILPVLSLALPGWNLLPTRADDVRLPVAVSRTFDPIDLHPSAPANPVDLLIVSPAPQSPWWSKVSTSTWIGIIWTAGAILCLTPPLLGRWLLRRLEQKRCTTMSDARWLRITDQCRSDLGIERSVKLLLSDARTMPMTWGIVRPRVLLPREAREWPEERVRVVLLHELAHVKRRDCLTHLLAQIARAIHWFNPLTWVAVWRMQVERECACDDLVLRLGTRETDYARQLVEVTTGLGARGLAMAAMPMARRSRLESRVREILNVRRNRGTLSKLGLLILFLAVSMVAVTVSCVKAADGEANQPDAPASQPAQPVADGADADPIVAETSVCAGNLRMLVTAILLYANEHDGRLPPNLAAALPHFPRTWQRADEPKRVLTEEEKIAAYVCPLDLKNLKIPEKPDAEWINQNTSYVYQADENWTLDLLGRNDGTIVAHEKPERGHQHPDHGHLINAVFVDGHVEALKLEQFRQTPILGGWTPEMSECGSNIRTIVMAIHRYAMDHEKRMPPDLGALLPYVEDANAFICSRERQNIRLPEKPTPQWVNENASYIYLGNEQAILSQEKIPEDAWGTTMLVHEKPDAGHEHPKNKRIIVAAMADGHAEVLLPEMMKQRIDESKTTLAETALRAGADRDGNGHPDPRVAQEQLACISNIRDVIKAIQSYAADHGGQLPPDLGSTLKYLQHEDEASDKMVPVAPADAAATYLCPHDRKKIKVPERPTPEWINRNSSFVYLGNAKLNVKQFGPETILVHERLDLGHGLVINTALGDFSYCKAVLRKEVGPWIDESKQKLAAADE